MDKHVEIGSRGWEYDQWGGTFYPDTLPAEWRLTYYSNEFRCVWVPFERWIRTDMDELVQWSEDVPPGFAFYFEFAGLGQGEIDARVLQTLSDMSTRLAEHFGGVLVPMSSADGGDINELVEVLKALRDLGPVDVDWPRELSSSEYEAVLEAGAGLCWRPRGIEPRAGARVGILGRGQAGDGRRALSQTVGRFLEQAPERNDLTLFFEGDPPAVESMQDAGVIAPLLGA